MSLPDTGDIGFYYCPDCLPDLDPFEHREDGKVPVVRYCGDHPHGFQGQADKEVAEKSESAQFYMSGLGEAGEESRRMGALLHHGEIVPASPQPPPAPHTGDDCYC